MLVEGLAHRLANSGPQAVLIKRSFVDAPVTAHITKRRSLGEGGSARPSDSYQPLTTSNAADSILAGESAMALGRWDAV